MQTPLRFHLCSLLALAAFSGAATAQSHVYVDKNNASTSQDGTSWATAYSDLFSTVCQFDLDSDHDVIIHVAEGVYSRSSGESLPIVMREGVRIWGENAFTVVFDGGGFGAGFVFSTDPTQFTVTDPCTGDIAAIPGTFVEEHGSYLANLTVRNFRHGVELCVATTPGACGRP